MLVLFEADMITSGSEKSQVRQCLGFFVLVCLWISWTKSQTLPNLRLPISSAHDQWTQILGRILSAQPRHTLFRFRRQSASRSRRRSARTCPCSCPARSAKTSQRRSASRIPSRSKSRSPRRSASPCQNREEKKSICSPRDILIVFSKWFTCIHLDSTQKLNSRRNIVTSLMFQ